MPFALLDTGLQRPTTARLGTAVRVRKRQKAGLDGKLPKAVQFREGTTLAKASSGRSVCDILGWGNSAVFRAVGLDIVFSPHTLR